MAPYALAAYPRCRRCGLLDEIRGAGYTGRYQLKALVRQIRLRLAARGRLEAHRADRRRHHRALLLAPCAM